MKQCSKCGATKASSEYYAGYNQCKACCKTSRDKYRRSDAYREILQAYHKTPKYKGYQKAYKRSATYKRKRHGYYIQDKAKSFEAKLHK